MNDDVENDDSASTALVAFQSNALLRAEIDTQISTAKAFPRSLKQFKDKAREMATLDKETAASCTYSKPVGNGKIATGPSARFAEIIAVAWKNLRFGGQVMSEDAEFVRARGVAHDLENNVQATMDVSGSIMTTGKNGQKPRRYQNSQIAVVGSATASIALRNAVLKVIPKAYWKPIYDESVKAALGEGATFAESRRQWIAYFTKKNVKLEAILATLGKPAVDDVDIDDLATLMGLANAIKDQELTLEQAFAPRAEETAAAKASEKLAGAPRNNGQKPTQTDAPTAKDERQPGDEPPETKGEEAEMDADTEMEIGNEMARTGKDQSWLSEKVTTAGAKRFRHITQTAAAGILSELREMPNKGELLAGAPVGTGPMAGPRQAKRV